MAGEGDDPHVLLVRLEAEEKEVSARRRQLHERLASFPNEVTERQEREISARRRALHAEIDRLRALLATQEREAE